MKCEGNVYSVLLRVFFCFFSTSLNQCLKKNTSIFCLNNSMLATISPTPFIKLVSNKVFNNAIGSIHQKFNVYFLKYKLNIYFLKRPYSSIFNFIC